MGYKKIFLILLVIAAVFTVGCIDNGEDSGMETDNPGESMDDEAMDSGDGGSDPGEIENVLSACQPGYPYTWDDPEADQNVTTTVVGPMQRDGYSVCELEATVDSSYYENMDEDAPEEFQMNITRINLYVTENEEYASIEYYDENDVMRMLMTMENEELVEMKFYDENGEEIDLFGDIPDEYADQIEG